MSGEPMTAELKIEDVLVGHGKAAERGALITAHYRGWLEDGAFLDGVAIANVLPAPLVIFATFVGWMSGGLFGALAITAGMFLPAFAFSLIFYERLEALVDDRRLQALLAGIAAAVVGIIAVTALWLGRAAVATTSSLSLSVGLFVVALLVRLSLAYPEVFRRVQGQNLLATLRSFLVSVGRSKNTNTHKILYSLRRMIKMAVAAHHRRLVYLILFLLRPQG